MTFTFVHTADWQLGKRFGGFPPETQALLRAARLDALDRIGAIAANAGARHVLVAGDVFDDARASQATLRQGMARLAALGGVTWHLMPGNHDAHRAGGVFERAIHDGLPDNVRIHVEAAPVEIEPGVFLLPAPLTSRASAGDPSAWMDAAATPPGALRIGLAHGSIRGFGSAGDAAVPIDPRRPDAAGLVYLALGDWHGVQRIGERVWYSGTPEPDNFVGNDKGEVLVVRAEAGGGPVSVTRARTAHFDWLELALNVSAATDLDALDQAIAARQVPAARVLLRLALSGSSTIPERQSIIARLERLAPSLRFAEHDLDQLVIASDGLDLAATEPADDFDRLMRALASEATTEGAGPDSARVARRALELLFEIDATAAVGSTR